MNSCGNSPEADAKEIGERIGRDGSVDATDRLITEICLDSMGNIAALADPGQWWSPRSWVQVVRDIENGVHTYCIDRRGLRLRITVAHGACGKYLQVLWDDVPCCNLHEIPAIHAAQSPERRAVLVDRSGSGRSDDDMRVQDLVDRSSSGHR